MKALKIPTAAMDSTTIKGPDAMKKLAIMPTNTTSTPTNSHLPKLLKSVLMTVAQLAMAKKMPAVAPKASMMSCAPLLKRRVWVSKPESISPIKAVKAKSTATPTPEFLVF